MTEFCTGKASDREDIIDFINMVFSQNECPHDFKALLPKLYGDASDTSASHFLAKEDGKIKAAVGLFPTELVAGGLRLKLGHIGSVSVHSYARGKGYMKRLMAMAYEAAKRGGYDALVLGGKKNRYQYFGFQPTETVMKYIFVPENFTHQYTGGSDSISFEKVNSADSAYIDSIRRLYEKRPAYMDRGDNDSFYQILSSWSNSTYAVLKNGRFAGYINGGGMQTDGGVQTFGEWGLKEMLDFPAVIAAWFLQKQPSVLTVFSPSYNRTACELLGKYCESFGSVMNHSWHILNFGNVIEALMQVKNKCEPLEAGSMAIAIRKYDESMELCKLSVDGGRVHVHAENFEAGRNSKDTASLESDRLDGAAITDGIQDCEKGVSIGLLDATEALFSEAVRYRSYGLDGGLRCKNWFPLPLYIDDNDAC